MNGTGGYNYGSQQDQEGIRTPQASRVIKNFKKGSRPQEWTATPDKSAIRKKLIATSRRMMEDYKAGVFNMEKPFAVKIRMVYGNTVGNSAEAIIFNNHHEAMHLGIIWQMRKLV